jgi:hypothetical protein
MRKTISTLIGKKREKMSDGERGGGGVLLYSI